MVQNGAEQRNVRIEQPRLLLVEGTNDYWFFRRLIQRRQTNAIQIIKFGGRYRLGDFLTGILMPRIRSAGTVKVIGVVRDADESYERAFQSVGDSLRRAGLPVPQAPLTCANGTLDSATIGAATYIMPDNRSPGDLEALCLDAVRDTPAMPCVGRYFDCLQSISHVPRQESKARLRAFLAAHPDDPTLRSGEAIAAGVIPWNSPAFVGVRQFLDMLDAVS